MYRKLIVVATCLLALALCWPLAPARAREEEQGKGKGKVGKIMQEKLKNSQKVLEGIALGDYDKITRSAEELIQLRPCEIDRSVPRPIVREGHHRRTLPAHRYPSPFAAVT